MAIPNSTEGRTRQTKVCLPLRPPPGTGAMVDYWLVARVCLHCFSRGENEAEGRGLARAERGINITDGSTIDTENKTFLAREILEWLAQFLYFCACYRVFPLSAKTAHTHTF